MKTFICKQILFTITFFLITYNSYAQTETDKQEKQPVTDDKLKEEKVTGASKDTNEKNEHYKIVIVRDELRMYLYKGDEEVKNFKISCGSERIGRPTPAGRFRVISKVKDPETHWSDGTVIPPGDWRNPYGPRWLGLGEYENGKYHGYGIHGTNSPEDIGKKISIGCIRMYNEDVLELFEIVKMGTEVVIK